MNFACLLRHLTPLPPVPMLRMPCGRLAGTNLEQSHSCTHTIKLHALFESSRPYSCSYLGWRLCGLCLVCLYH